MPEVAATIIEVLHLQAEIPNREIFRISVELFADRLLFISV